MTSLSRFFPFRLRMPGLLDGHHKACVAATVACSIGFKPQRLRYYCCCTGRIFLEERLRRQSALRRLVHGANRRESGR